MNILHLVSQYDATTVYKELVTHMAKIANTDQLVFVGLRKGQKVCKNMIENKEKLKIKVVQTHGKLSRIIFFTRISSVMKALEKNVEIKKYNIVHAHTLFADGGTALLIKKKYGIDYVVSVRETDIGGYLKKLPHSRLILNEIIVNAKKIIFISPSMKNVLLNYLNKKARAKLETNSVCISNGISDYWLENINQARTIAKEGHLDFIQVSSLMKRKNVDKTIFAIKELNNIGIKAHVTVVGTGPYGSNLKKNVEKNGLTKYVTFLGQIKEKDQLKNIYRNNDIFIMPSNKETFGLVYAEAMSQGLPIIYTKGTGIYGYFSEGEVGFGVEPENIEDIVEKIQYVIQNYDDLSKNCINYSKLFHWDSIVKRIYDIYAE